MNLKELTEWMGVNKFVDFGDESVDGCGNEEVQKIYSVDGKLFAVDFCNGSPTAKYISGKGYLPDTYEPYPVRAVHQFVVQTDYEECAVPQSFEASKFKVMDLVELVADVSIKAEFVGDIQFEDAKTYPAGTRGAVEEVRGDSITVSLGLNESLYLNASQLRILHSSPERVLSMAKSFHKIREWALRKAGEAYRASKSKFRLVGSPENEAGKAMRVIVATQPSVTLEDAYAQMERIHGPTWRRPKKN